MAVFAVYIEKEVQYFGGAQLMGNTYHYKTGVGEPFNDAAFATALAAAEKNVTEGSVAFKSWRTWGPTDGPIIDNIIRDDGLLTGTGFGSAQPGQYKESCALFVWPLARSAVLNRRRWLRKFIRMGAGGSTPFQAAVLAGQAQIPAANQTAMLADYGNAIVNLGGFGHTLCTAFGDTPTGPAEIRPFLYTRQIGQ